MPKVAVLDMAGKEVSSMELSDAIFGIKPNESVMHQMVVNYLANQRQGTQSTLTRTEVRGGGRKPWKQKGTGRARAGSVRSPLWVGGGTIFGPSPRSHAIDMPRKARRLAIRCALSSKVADGSLVIVDGLTFADNKTKNTVEMLKGFEASDKKALIITDGENENVELSSRNIEKVKALSNDCLNVFDILNAEKVLLAKDAVARIEEVLA